MSIVILANGEFPQGETALQTLRTAEHVVCCDGAAEKLLASGIRKPDIVIGDLDSLAKEMQSEIECPLVRIGEQETNDLQKAWRHCLAEGWHDIAILGATGFREDHTLGNISLLIDFAESSPGIRMITDHGEFQTAIGRREFESWAGRQISIFSFDASQRITSAGLKYPLVHMKLSRLWQGTLNESQGKSFTITVEGGKTPVLVYLKY